jgi:colicin import membrane protein
MKSGGLFSEIKNHPKILALVILFHIVLIVLLSINLASDDKPPMPMAQKHKIISAVVVDAKKYDERKKQKKLAEQKKIADKKAAEKKRQQELERKKAAEKKRLAEKKKAAKQKRQKEIQLTKKKEREKKERERKAKEKKAAELKAAKIKEEKRKAKEKALKEKQRLEAEKKRKAEEERKRRAEEKADLERAVLEEERREEEARKAAAREARLQTQRQQYIMQIAQKVENNWLRPATTSEGQSCDVIVTQTMRGDVIDVRLQSCTSDNAFQRSVERAVRKASPLPLPPNPDVFDRTIQFKFNPRK